MADICETDSEKYNRRIRWLNNPDKYKFNASVSLSPMTGAGFGLIADEGGIPPLSVLEFTDGTLGWSWSDNALHTTGFIIHLYNGRAYIVKDLMDYKQKGRCWTNTPSADFLNTTLQHGQTVSQHCRHRLPIRGYTLAQLIKMFETQSCIIACLIDDEGKTRVFAESIQHVEFNMEALCLYDLNSYCCEFGARYDPHAPQVGFATWTVLQKVEWSMAKLQWDPSNHWNLAVAIIDMIRRDLRVILTITDTEMQRHTGLHSTWFSDLIFRAKEHFFEHDGERLRARARRDGPPRTPCKELFYHLDLCEGCPMWPMLGQLEYDISRWIHTQWLELRTLGLYDERGLALDDRPFDWMRQLPAWSYGWWTYLRRVDRINVTNSRPYFVSTVLGDAQLTDEHTMPYGTTANRAL